MLRRMRAPVAVILLLGGLAGVGLLVAELGTAEQETAQKEKVTFDAPPGLVTSNRSVRSLCVDGAGGASVSSAEVEMIRQATVDALDSIKDTYTFLEEQGEPVISQGCPPPTGLSGQPGPRKGRIGRGVAVPSEHVAFVYFVPEDAYHDSFGDYPYGRAGEELYCIRRSACSSVTEGLYVTPSVSPEALREGLLDALTFR